jgi:hypothetical protein
MSEFHDALPRISFPLFALTSIVAFQRIRLLRLHQAKRWATT